MILSGKFFLSFQSRPFQKTSVQFFNIPVFFQEIEQTYGLGFTRLEKTPGQAADGGKCPGNFHFGRQGSEDMQEVGQRGIGRGDPAQEMKGGGIFRHAIWMTQGVTDPRQRFAVPAQYKQWFHGIFQGGQALFPRFVVEVIGGIVKAFGDIIVDGKRFRYLAKAADQFVEKATQHQSREAFCCFYTMV
jgi:hypothetical protein